MPHFVEVPPQRAVYRVKGEPGPLPINLDEVKAYLRVDSDADDKVIQLMIQAATTSAERLTSRELRVRTYVATFDVLQPAMQLRRNLVDVIVSIKYIPTDGSIFSSTVATTVYFLRVNQWWNTVDLLPNQDWPDDVSDRQQAVEIEFTTKLQDASTMDLIKFALMATIAEMYANRGDCLAKGFDKVADMAGGKYLSQFTIPRI